MAYYKFYRDDELIDEGEYSEEDAAFKAVHEDCVGVRK